MYINDIYPYRNDLISVDENYRELQHALKHLPYRSLCTIDRNGNREELVAEVARINTLIHRELQKIYSFLFWLEENKEKTIVIRYGELDDEVLFELTKITIILGTEEDDFDGVKIYAAISGKYPDDTNGQIEWFWVDHIYLAWCENRVDARSQELEISPPLANPQLQPEDLYNTFAKVKLYEIANAIATEINPDKIVDCVILICVRFKSLKELYYYLAEQDRV